MIVANVYKEKQMRINAGSIGGLIGVLISSIAKWGYQDNFKPVYFFFTKKISRVKNTSQAKMNLQNKFKQTLTNKKTIFCAR